MRINDPAGHPNARPFDGWSIDESGLLLTVWWEWRRGKALLFTAEESDAVYVLGLDAKFPPDPDIHDGIALDVATDWPGDFFHERLVARLTSPLGQRTVIDAATGASVR